MSFKVYFSIRGIISLVNISKAGLIAEFATLSNEGMIASAAFLEDDVASLARSLKPIVWQLAYPSMFCDNLIR